MFINGTNVCFTFPPFCTLSCSVSHFYLGWRGSGYLESRWSAKWSISTCIVKSSERRIFPECIATEEWLNVYKCSLNIFILCTKCKIRWNILCTCSGSQNVTPGPCSSIPKGHYPVTSTLRWVIGLQEK